MLAHGRCEQREIDIQVLRRVEGQCEMVYRDGIQMIVDQWEVSYYPVRVGCECRIHQYSMFSRFTI